MYQSRLPFVEAGESENEKFANSSEASQRRALDFSSVEDGEGKTHIRSGLRLSCLGDVGLTPRRKEQKLE